MRRRLSGKSRVVGGDVYEIFVTIPPGYSFDRAEGDGAAVLKTREDGAVLRVSLKSEESREVSWGVRFHD
jgi:hypothetical protein